MRDVRDTSALVQAVGDRSVDIITAGFPCLGFSLAGRRKGLGDERSGLVRSVLDAVTALHPRLVMLENAPGVLTLNGGKDLVFIAKQFTRRGYDFRWTTCAAQDVGLPHKRERWFCLCIRRGDDLMLPTKLNTLPQDSRTRAMPMLLAPRAPSYSVRYFLLGNAVVPAVVRRVFRVLVAMDTSGKHSVIKSQYPAHGFWRSGGACCPEKMNHVVHRRPGLDHAIILCPDQYQPVYIPRNVRRAAPITKRLLIRIWPTPRATAPRHSNSLSARNVRDLPTATLFACSVQGRRQPHAVQGMTVNPTFVEWLMGFPKGWTDLVMDGAMTQAQIESREANRLCPRVRSEGSKLPMLAVPQIVQDDTHTS